MYNNRRSFIKKVTASSLLTFGGISSSDAADNTEFFELENTDTVITDEGYWNKIRKQFNLSKEVINLNSGNISPTPIVVQNAVIKQMEFCNKAPSYNMLRVLEQNREALINNLAQFAGCQPNEIIINRNASEGLQTIIFGLKLEKSDEIVLSKYDYPHLIDAWKQRELRDGIKLVWVDLQLPSEDENYMVNAFTRHFNSKTKLVNLTHIINWNGQIIPVKKIIDEAKNTGIQTLVDAAHSFALLPYKITDYNCDYLVASMHKWLYAPTGTGFLYIKKERIKDLFPLFAHSNPKSDSIDKFTHLGTRPMYMDYAINEAINFNTKIGSQNKLHRLLYLKTYWIKQLSEIKLVKFQTSLDESWSSAMANVYINGVESYKLDQFLFSKYQIHTVCINREKINSVRITPNIFTTIKELDLLAEGIRAFIDKEHP